MSYPLAQCVIDAISELDLKKDPSEIPQNQYFICQGIFAIMRKMHEKYPCEGKLENAFTEIWENVKNFENLEDRIHKLLDREEVFAFRFGIPIEANEGETAVISEITQRLELTSDEPKEENSPYVLTRNFFILLTKILFGPNSPPYRILDHEKIVYQISENTKALSGLQSRIRNLILA